MKKRTRLLFNGFIPIASIALLVTIIVLLGIMDNFVGEVFRKISGIMFTPFFLEASFAILGIIAVFAVNHIRRQKEGDEYVELEIPDQEDDSQP